MQTIAEAEEETEGDDLKTDFSRLKKKKKGSLHVIIQKQTYPES